MFSLSERDAEEYRKLRAIWKAQAVSLDEALPYMAAVYRDLEWDLEILARVTGKRDKLVALGYLPCADAVKLPTLPQTTLPVGIAQIDQIDQSQMGYDDL